ncbi:MerR family transcriptional regulator [uncultured Streptomyces sp.]|uniref:helix-turn-helix domain-containing protein n=1 Tax=uncultured Streptomyces sp. TaxID=174707 RepID=UPI0026394054|nr:MerR family transcriptional regulator [uncultured Streptomyces sp.]
MRIGDAAASAGTTPRALRFYEQRGLLAPPARTSSGQREYGAEDVARVRLVRELLASGLTVEDVRACADRLHLLASGGPVVCTATEPGSPGVVGQRLAALDAEIARLTDLRQTLARKVGAPAAGRAGPAGAEPATGET